MPIYHVLLGIEGTSQTWEAPSNAFNMENWQSAVNQEYTDIQVTGSQHGLYDSWHGAFAPSGSGQMKLYENWIPAFLKVGGFTEVTSAQVDATTAYLHQCLPAPEDANVTASIQVQHGAADAENWRGVLINKMTFSCKAKEIAMLAFDFLAVDSGVTGQNWGDGTSAPSVIASPTYLGDSVGVLHFANVTITKDASLALNTTTNVVTPTSGSSVTIAEMAEISIENNYLYRHVLGTARYPTLINRQNRTVTGKLDIDFSTFDETWYEAMRGGTTVTLQFKFTGSNIESGQPYHLLITLPRVTIRGANLPDVTGNQAARVQTVEFTAQVDPSFVDSDGYPYDIHIEVKDDVTAYSTF